MTSSLSNLHACKESFASLASLVFSLPLPPDLQPIHSHVLRALFGILLKFKQAKWKNCPFSHNGLWHFRSLSEGSGFLLHTHMQSSLRASSKISFVCVLFNFSFLPAAVFWHRGQKHLFGTFWTFKLVKWKEEMGHAWLLHATTSSVVFILQKQTELRPDNSWDTFLFWVYNTVSPKVIEFGNYRIPVTDIWVNSFTEEGNLFIKATNNEVSVIVSSIEHLLLRLVIVCMFSFKTSSSFFWLQT